MVSRITLVVLGFLLGGIASFLWTQRNPYIGAIGGEDTSQAQSRNLNIDYVKNGVPANPSAPASDSSKAAKVPSIPRIRTLAETSDIRSEFLQSASLYQLAAPLNADGIRALLDEAKLSLSDGDYLGGTSLLIGRYAELDFAAALDYALGNGGQARARWLHAIFHARARIDINDALQQAQQLTKNQQQIAGVALLRSNNQLSSKQRRDIINKLQLPAQLVATTQRRAQDAWREAASIPNVMQRVGTQARILISWAKSEPWAALKASEEIDSAMGGLEIQGRILGLAASDDPQRALDWLNAQPPGQQRDRIIATLVDQLSKTDPDQAKALVQALPEKDRPAAELSLWTNIAMRDPEGAAHWIANLDTADTTSAFGAMQQLAPNQILVTLGMSSNEYAERFLDALPIANRKALEPSYVGLLAQSDPQAAAIRVASISDPERRGQAAQELVGAWASSNPEQAMHWIERQPSNETPQLYRSLGSMWGYQDLDAAKKYADNMSAGSGRDQMYTGLLTSGLLEPSEIEELSQRIESEELRSQVKQTLEAIRQSISG